MIQLFGHELFKLQQNLNWEINLVYFNFLNNTNYQVLDKIKNFKEDSSFNLNINSSVNLSLPANVKTMFTTAYQINKTIPELKSMIANLLVSCHHKESNRNLLRASHPHNYPDLNKQQAMLACEIVKSTVENLKFRPPIELTDGKGYDQQLYHEMELEKNFENFLQEQNDLKLNKEKTEILFDREFPINSTNRIDNYDKIVRQGGFW